MSANVTLLVLIGILVACGVYLVLERAVSKMLLGMILFGNAVNLLIITVGGPDGRAPILGETDRVHHDTADPLAQAMVLTSIVITMGLAAFVLALAYRSFALTTTDRVENDPEDVKVASRREGEDPEQ
ncbi:Na(+)/H(+) antiporter subunit C [Nocardia terpenica]|uniref:Cation:proton antiporter n=1 Tax=Nocardia terpenica TaxID=455432 RepID=A0A164K4G8_9NOCA|nr:Na(+)/H(+) antiporter subunit C [Nocardia terpenica]ATL71039.1 Na(+)/H(+) antiporter subunit C [Nocardia terpenica]KZM71017.1 cation:proton antiporter [Nocardia terpenica]MBF6062647.1 Na(+)/H(+) antiporter subunit C [Nocardia terpenica]MBF6105218.1 Na(+)/H(+) antiporter subunit C [Nocardia terpenica]MBF6112345.1 Na(+)/H(+) antiporter subunit C [Nocardia terpenica]